MKKNTFKPCWIYLSLAFFVSSLTFPNPSLALRDPHQPLNQQQTLQEKHGTPGKEYGVVSVQSRISQDGPKVLTRSIKDLAMLDRDLGAELTAEDDVEAALRQNLSQTPQWLGGVAVDDLKVVHFANVFSADGYSNMIYISFAQTKEGLNVNDSFVSFTIGVKDGRSVIRSARAKLYQDVRLPRRMFKVKKKMDFKAKACKALKMDPARAKVKEEKRKVRFFKGKWRRVNNVFFKGRADNGVVDEDTGESWQEDRRMFQHISGDVVGRGISFDPLATGSNLNLLPMGHLEVNTENSNTTHTNSFGTFDFPTETSPAQVDVALVGLWTTVTTQVGTNLTLSAVGTPGVPMYFLFNPVGANEFDTAQVTAFYHTNYIHDWVQSKLGGATLPGIDIQIPTIVNINDSCNAYYTQGVPSLNYFRAGGSCINTAYDTVVYHEYGHFVDDMAGGIQNTNAAYGLSEGWGDVLAAYGSGQPGLGIGFFGVPGVPLRTADNNYQYPPSGFDPVHTLGQAWSGFAWHLRENLIASLGDEAAAIALAEDLVIPVVLANPPDIPSAVFEVLLRDDDDNDLSNGTPHKAEIDAAANQHSIPLPEEDFIAPDPVTDLVATNTGLAKVTLNFTASGDDGSTGTAHQYDVRYSLNPILNDTDFTNAQQVLNLPSPQPAGTPEQFDIFGLLPGQTYHVAIKVFDNLFNASAVSNSAPVSVTVGQVDFSDDFESGATGWTVTGTLWHLDNQRYSSFDTSYAYNDGVDYDTGASNTGTIVTPPIDLTDAGQALLSFNHWFESEEFMFYDIKWIDISTDGGQNWTFLRQISNVDPELQQIWQQEIIDLTPFIDNVVQVRFNFDTVDQFSNNFEGWYVDDVTVVSVPAVEVIWVDPVGVDVNGNNLQKTAATGWGNSGAASLRFIPNDGGVDVRLDEIDTWRMIGLSPSNTDADYNTITYGLGVTFYSTLEVWESGSPRGVSVPYNSGDRVSVIRDGNTVEYRHNGVVFYTSTIPSSGDLVVDVALHDNGATVADANIMGGVLPPNNPPVAEDQSVTVIQGTATPITLVATDAEMSPLTYTYTQPTFGVVTGIGPDVTYTPNGQYTGPDSFTFFANDGTDDSNVATVTVTVQFPPAPVTWVDAVGVIVNGNTLQKNVATQWGNSGAASLSVIPADGGIDVRADERNTWRMIGLSPSNTDENYTSITYGLLLTNFFRLEVWEQGAYKGTYPLYAVGDRASVKRVGNTVEYLHNGEVFYTSTIPSSGSLVADVALYTNGATIVDAQISGGALPPNIAPVAEDQNVTVNQGTPTQITLVATDAEMSPLTYTYTQPTFGVVTGTGPDVTYTPNGQYTGPDSFTFFANDGTDDSNTATVSITVQTPPTQVSWVDTVGVSVNGNTITKSAGNGWGNAGAASLRVIPGDGGVDVRTDELTTWRMVGLSPSNTDANFDTITYGLGVTFSGNLEVWELGGQKGIFNFYDSGDRVSINRVGNTVEYRHNGTTFYTSTIPSSGDLVVDVSLYSNGATIADANINGGILPPNNPPVAQDQNVTVNQGTPTQITLVATDAEMSPLTYTYTQPTFGVVTGTGPDVTYTPNGQYTGPDSFTFFANDGTDDSNVATVSITVQTPPTQVIWGDLVGVDVTGNTITKNVATGWGNAGAASLRVISGDGGVDVRTDELNTWRMVGLSPSNTDANYGSITYGIGVTFSSNLEVWELGGLKGVFNSYASGDRVSIVRVGSSVEYRHNNVAFYTSTIPSSGDLVVDVSLYSNGATIADANISGGILPPNNPPVAQDQSVTVIQSTPTIITLVATDVEMSPLTYTYTQPTNGVVTGTGPDVTYAPTLGYLGSDSFTFFANDGTDDSNVATISITVAEPGSGPQPVVWTDALGVNVNGNTITKAGGVNSWNAGAGSTKTIPADGGVDFLAVGTNTHRMGGLSGSNPDANYATIEYSLYLATLGRVYVYENGTDRGQQETYSDQDRFQVIRTGSTVEYRKNGIAFYTSTIPSSGSLVVDSSIYTPNASIDDAQIIGGL